MNGLTAFIRRSPSWDFLGVSSAVKQMPGYLCTAPGILSLSPLSLTDRRDTWGKWLLASNRIGARGTATLAQGFFRLSLWLRVCRKKICVASFQNCQNPCWQRDFLLAQTIIRSFICETMVEGKESKHGTPLRNWCTGFWGTLNIPSTKKIAQCMLAELAQGCKMNLKINFLHSYIKTKGPIVKSRVKDFARMYVILSEDTKNDGTSTC